MTPWKDATPVLFLVVPPRDATSTEQDEARLTLERWAKLERWRPVTRRTMPYSLNRGKNTGRRLQVMEPRDARDLYKLSHRNPTAVVQIGQPIVRLDPSALPSERNSISLERFVRYKTFFRMLGREGGGAGIDVDRFLSGFHDWRQHCTCDGERDARCIPLHVFSPSREWKMLHNPSGVKEFESCHGRASSRVDEEKRGWSPGWHGREVIHVAGAALQSGFHWDVESIDGASSLCTSTEVWRFSRREYYCNVYPDATVRKGQRRGLRAKLIYEAPRPDVALVSGTRPQRTQGQRRERRG